MKKVDVDGVEPTVFGEGSTRRALTGRLGTSELSLNRYRIAPGGGLPGGLHAHADQEEVFVVLEGTATFETTDGEVTVGEHEAIRFAPGEFQSGKNEADDELVVLAVGAPRDTEDVRIPAACPECGHETLRLDTGDELTFVCPDCESEYVPRACPECGHDDLRFTIDDANRPVVVCRRCRAEFERPPLRDPA